MPSRGPGEFPNWFSTTLGGQEHKSPREENSPRYHDRLFGAPLPHLLSCGMIISLRQLALPALVFLLACGGDERALPEMAADEESCPNPGLIDQPVGDEFYATADDFSCFLEEAQEGISPAKRWYPVRKFYVRNLAGRTQEALDVACGRQEPPYPVGTVLQLIYFEAMVKRGGDFGPEANGWEFFALDVTQATEDAEALTTIHARGVTDAVNFAGGNCFECHQQARPEADFVCETENGCDPIPVNDSLLQTFQRGDPRCK